MIKKKLYDKFYFLKSFITNPALSDTLLKIVNMLLEGNEIATVISSTEVDMGLEDMKLTVNKSSS